MTTFAKQYAESLSQVSGRMALIADRDQFIAASGGYKGLLGKRMSREMEDTIANRESLQVEKGDKGFIPVSEEDTPQMLQFVSVPIIAEGDAIGVVVLAANDTEQKMGEVEKKLVQSAAGFLGRQMEQ
jgi:AbrB family transcriptional regulator (stage V sporulation protein T)